MRHSIILAFLLLISFHVSAQEREIQSQEKERSMLYLKSGAQLEVTIIDWDLEKGIKAITLWDQEIFFPKDEVVKVKSLTKNSKYNPYQFRDKGIYYAIFGGLITSNHGERLNGTNGYSFSFSSGYRFHRLLSVGLGTGLDQYAHKSGERVHPIYLDLRSFLMKSNTSFVVNLQTGYSLAFNDDIKSIVDSKGGFMFYPSIGLSFGNTATKYSFDVGYKFQRATWTYADTWDVRNETEYRMNYQRFVMRFGIVL